jgi:hypothetical protein
MTQEKLYPIEIVPQFKTFINLLEKGELNHKIFIRRKTKESPYRMGYEVNMVKPEHLDTVKSMFKWFNYSPVVYQHKNGKYRLRVRSNNLVSGFSGLQFFHTLLNDFTNNNETMKEVWTQYLTRMEEKHNKELLTIDGDLPF